MDKWDKYSFVVRGKLRSNVILALSGPKTPTQLAKTINTSLPNVSRVIAELEKASLIKCLTPNIPMGKVYTLTNEGKAIQKELK